MLLLVAPGLPLAAVPEGFVIKKFAGPPEVEYPTGISAAANGDVYVSVDQNGSLGHREDFGRIVRARDTDGDGEADDFVDFVPTLDSPRGGHFTGGTFYVIHPPYLSSFRDTDGDGVADERKQLVEGFGWGIEHPRGADHTTNGVHMGIDGWLYVGVGDFGMPDAAGADGTRLTLHGGGVVRVRPDGSEMEPYALMTRNHFAPAISPYLDLFVRDNTNDGKGWNTRFHHFTAMGDHGYPRLYQNFAEETIRPLADYGGGSGTGAAYIDEPGLPEAFGDTVFTCDWTTGHVYYHPLERFEATFVADQKVFHKLPRATDIDVDGFSRLYLADWRNGKFRYAGPDTEVGLIHRVTFPEGEAGQYVEVTEVSDAALPDLLGSRSAVQRLEAQREMIRRGRKTVFAEKSMALAKDPQAPLKGRVAAIFTFKQLYGPDATRHLVELTGDAAIREFALRAMTDRLGELDDVPLDPYLDALDDPDPRVRLQAAIGLGRLRATAAAPALLQAAASWTPAPAELPDGAHPRLPHTAVKALARIGNVEACLRALEDPGQRPLALRALEEIHGPEAVAGLIEVIDDPTDVDLLEDGLAALARLYHVEAPWDLESWWGTRPDDRGPYFKPVEWEGTPEIRAAIERHFVNLPRDRRSPTLEILAKNRINLNTLDLGEADALTWALAAESLDDSQLLLLLDAARDSTRPWDLRIRCYRGLSKADPEQVTPARLAVLADWSQQSDAPDAVIRAIEDFVNAPERATEIGRLRRLAKRESDAVSRIAWTALLTVHQSPLSKPEAKQAVTRALDELPRELGFFRALADLGLSGFEPQIAAGLQSDNETLIAAAEAAREAAETDTDARTVAELEPAEILDYAMNHRGDPRKGRRLFTAQGCIACHSVDPDAEPKGPYLGNAGTKFTRDYLIESITEPAKVVAQGFRTTVFELADGTALMGFVTAEADGVIDLRDIAGQTTRFRRDEVETQRELPTSMMPPALGDNLTPDEFTSLIDYLVALKAEDEK
jgi:putative heme-binding domain-containing protein